jgi:hypothetical protein
VQTAVDTTRHLIVAHEVTNVGTDRSQRSNMAKQAKTTLETERLDVVADRGYFNSAEILACAQAGVTVTLPKPMTSGAKSEGRFGKQDFRYVAEDDVYLCPAGERLTRFHTTKTRSCHDQPSSQNITGVAFHRQQSALISAAASIRDAAEHAPKWPSFISPYLAGFHFPLMRRLGCHPVECRRRGCNRPCFRGIRG